MTDLQYTILEASNDDLITFEEASMMLTMYESGSFGDKVKKVWKTFVEWVKGIISKISKKISDVKAKITGKSDDKVESKYDLEAVNKLSSEAVEETKKPFNPDGKLWKRVLGGALLAGSAYIAIGKTKAHYYSIKIADGIRDNLSKLQSMLISLEGKNPDSTLIKCLRPIINICNLAISSIILAHDDSNRFKDNKSPAVDYLNDTEVPKDPVYDPSIKILRQNAHSNSAKIKSIEDELGKLEDELRKESDKYHKEHDECVDKIKTANNVLNHDDVKSDQNKVNEIRDRIKKYNDELCELDRNWSLTADKLNSRIDSMYDKLYAKHDEIDKSIDDEFNKKYDAWKKKLESYVKFGASIFKYAIEHDTALAMLYINSMQLKDSDKSELVKYILNTMDKLIDSEGKIELREGYHHNSSFDDAFFIISKEKEKVENIRKIAKSRKLI